MWAVFVNVFTVIAGSLFGLLARNHISKRISDAIMIGLGACSVYIGLSGALSGSNTLVLILSMVLGGAIGTAVDIDGRLQSVGGFFQKRMKPGKGGNAVQAFVTASLLFCVGSMTIVGSLNAGLFHDYELLYTKSVMDLISSAMLAASLGIGVLFSAPFVLVFQGSICLLAGVIAPFLGDYARGEMICAGSVIIMMLGLNIMGISKLKVADYLPAILIAPILCIFL